VTNNATRGMSARVFVAHAYDPPSGAYQLAPYRGAIERSLKAAEDLMGQIGTVAIGGWDRIQLAPTFESAEFNSAVRDLVVDSIKSSDLAIVDLTDTSANVMYELGFLDASTIPTVLIVSKRSRTPVPVDIRGRYMVEYDELSDMESRLPALLVKCVEAMLRRSTVLPGDRDLSWFPASVKELHLVGALSPDNLATAEPAHRNFVYLERFSDKDTVLELMVLLSRMYSARIHKYTSEDFPKRQLLKANLFVVGGPGVENINEGNPICREMFTRVRSRIRYSPDGESVHVKPDLESDAIQLKPTYGTDGRLLRDFGYFARFPNPFAPDSTVVMINGLHTAGGLGAARAFSDLPQASENFRRVRSALDIKSGAPPAFEAIFEVETIGDDVLVPRVVAEYVFPL
jgi:hypothetical protein